jgi:hypothetical protein
MLDSVKKLLRKYSGSSPDAVSASRKASSQSHLTPEQMRIRWQQAVASENAEIILLALHALELDRSDAYAWPWLGWLQPKSAVGEPVFQLPKAAPKIDAAKSSDLAIDIYQQAFRVRAGDLGQIADIYAKVVKNPALLHSLPPIFLLELALYAFSDKKWALVKTICWTLLEGWRDGEKMLTERAAFLAFELLLRGHVQGAMPTFVHRSAELTSALDDIAADCKLLDKLGRTSQVVGVFEAARLAFSGDISGSVQAFDQLNKKAGFRTPIFCPSQVLIPEEDVVAAAEDQLQRWFADYSTIDHHFRHGAAQDHVFLVASEQNYMDRYGDLFAETLAMTNPGALVHFHLINMKDTPQAVLRMLDGWEKKFGLRINCSLETNKIMRELTPYTSGISVNTRYIYLPDYLNAYSSITLTDIDGWITAKTAALSDFGSHDTLISSWIWRVNVGHWRLPWANLAGGYISFRATEKTRRFAAFLRTYLLIVIKNNVPKGRRIVYADQAGLFLGLQYGIRKWGHSVGFLPKGGFDQSFEQREEFRHEGKRRAMQDKLAELKAQK